MKKVSNICLLLLLSAMQLSASTTGVKNYLNEKEINMETKVLLETSLGNITIKLYDETPKHRDNFIKLVNDGFYEGVLFHRIISGFMIQGGDPDSKNAAPNQHLGAGSVGYTLPAEFIYPKYYHKKGALAAARTGDAVNPERASSAMQFYIVTGKHFTEHELNKREKEENITFTPEQREAYKLEGGAPDLDGDYTIFGHVTRGLKIVQKIELTPVDYNDHPLKEVRIKKMKIIKKI